MIFILYIHLTKEFYLIKKLVIFFLFSVLVKVNAQTLFLPNIGTKWHYVFGQYGPSLNKYNAKIEYVKDSVYMGENIKILHANMIYSLCSYYTSPNVFIKQRNDSVWFLHTQQTNNTWQLLINFNANVGQSWNFTVMNSFTSSPTTTTYSITVNSINTVTINSLALKSFNVTYKRPNLIGSGTQTYTSTITERLGDTQFLFNIANKTPNGLLDGCAYVENLLCYEDSTFGLYQFTSNPCDYHYPNYVGLNESKIKDYELKIYPNPANGILNVELLNLASTGSATEIQIINTLGQVVHQSTIKTVTLSGVEGQQSAIDIKDLPEGVYQLKISEGKKQRVLKFIKN